MLLYADFIFVNYMHAYMIFIFLSFLKTNGMLYICLDRTAHAQLRQAPPLVTSWQLNIIKEAFNTHRVLASCTFQPKTKQIVKLY